MPSNRNTPSIASDTQGNYRDYNINDGVEMMLQEFTKSRSFKLAA